MPNINAFRPMVHKKKMFINIFLILPLIGLQKGPTTLFEQIRIPIPKHVSPPSLVEIGHVVREKKIFKFLLYKPILKYVPLGFGHL